MGTKGQVLLRDVWAMLDVCAPGWSKVEGRHNYRIRFAGLTYPGFPTGQHGKKPGRGEVQKGHVKDLAEFFGILDCAQHQIELLR